MAKLGGAFLKLLQTFLYGIEFCCAAIILGIYSYFLSVLADRNLFIAPWMKAVEGMSGAAVLYLVFAVILTCCLGGISFFAFLAIVLDILFCGAFIAIAVLTHDGARSCSGFVYTPLGNGPEDSRNQFGDNADTKNVTYAASLGTICRYNKVAFAVSIIAAILFLISALAQLFLGRHHQREKRYGPSPSNNYTTGSGLAPFWRRRRARKTHGTRDAEFGAVGAGALATDKHVRPSHETGYTGSTVAPPTAATATYDAHGKQIHGGYHTAPAGAGVNPYGYENTTRTPATNY